MLLELLCEADIFSTKTVQQANLARYMEHVLLQSCALSRDGGRGLTLVGAWPRSSRAQHSVNEFRLAEVDDAHTGMDPGYPRMTTSRENVPPYVERVSRVLVMMTCLGSAAVSPRSVY